MEYNHPGVSRGGGGGERVGCIIGFCLPLISFFNKLIVIDGLVPKPSVLYVAGWAQLA